MTKEETIKLLTQVCAVYRGTLKEHQMLQEAIMVLSEEEEKPKEKGD